MIPLNDLIHLATTDEMFRAELAADPETALRARGLQVSQETLQALERIQHLLMHSSQSLAAQVSSQIEEISEDWGRHLCASAVTHAAIKTAT